MSPSPPPKSATNWLGANSDSEDEQYRSEDDDRSASRTTTAARAPKRRRVASDEEDEFTSVKDRASKKDVVKDKEGEVDNDSEEDGDKDDHEEAEEEEAKEDDKDAIITNPSKLKPLSKAQMLASKKATAKTGVVYLSRIPPFMKPQKVKHLLAAFGPIGRIFLAPESPKAYSLRLRFGGNKKRNFDEGWVEFLNKKHAKLVAETLNANPIGGKKGGYYYDDVWNIKYLPKFKWHHLTEQIANENASRQSRLRAEISQATKENKTYIRNVERSKMVEKMEAAKKRKVEESGGGEEKGRVEKVDVRRQFRQRSSIKNGGRGKETDGGEGEEKMKALLRSVF